MKQFIVFISCVWMKFYVFHHHGILSKDVSFRVLVMAACVFICASYLTVIYVDGPVSAVNPDNSIVC